MVAPAPFFRRGPVRVIAHRGGAGLGPENSLAAMEHSIAAGADVLEVDVRCTRDEVFILHHDPTLARVAGLAAAPEQLLAAELERIDMRPFWAPPDGVDPSAPKIADEVRLPTLEQALRHFPDTRFALDVKLPHLSALRALYRLIRAHGAEDRILIGSFHGAVVREGRRMAPEIATHGTERELISLYMRATVGRELPARLPFQSVAVPEHWRGVPVARRFFIRALRERGVCFSVWTVNDPAKIRKLFRRGVDAIITDYPGRVSAVRAEQGAENESYG